MEITFCKIILFDRPSFKTLGKKMEINKVIIKRKAYWIPLRELTIGKNTTGTKNMAKLCKKLAAPPQA